MDNNDNKLIHLLKYKDIIIQTFPSFLLELY